MNRKIEAESKQGVGTTFTAFIPIQKATIEQVHQWNKTSLPDIVKVKITESETRIETDVKNNSPLILVVEDNEELRVFIAQSLQTNYHAITTANGEEAATVVSEELPDIIIRDVMMPEMDGYALCKKIKSNIAQSILQ